MIPVFVDSRALLLTAFPTARQVLAISITIALIAPRASHVRSAWTLSQRFWLSYGGVLLCCHAWPNGPDAVLVYKPLQPLTVSRACNRVFNP